MTNLVPDNVLIDGNRIAYGVHGDGEPVILIHGTPFFSHIWRKPLPQLVAAGLKVYVYDLLGFGHSERPRDETIDTSVSGQLPVLVELMNHWELEACHLVLDGLCYLILELLLVARRIKEQVFVIRFAC